MVNLVSNHSHDFLIFYVNKIHWTPIECIRVDWTLKPYPMYLLCHCSMNWGKSGRTLDARIIFSITSFNVTDWSFEQFSQKLISENGYYFLFPPSDRATDHISLLHTDAYRGTIREQFGYRYARTVWWFWYILDVIDGFCLMTPFPLSAYLSHWCHWPG